jgi:NAD(P)-dependent dehydrogenase (short-subunit alcohol dehydrogenase family)
MKGTLMSADGQLRDPLDARRTALVTGASRGIGRAVALALATAGYDVAITARTVVEGTNDEGLPGSLETTAAEITALGVTALPIPLDLLDRAALAPAADRVLAQWGRLDVLVNNAIYAGPGPQRRFVDEEPVEIEKRIFGNLTAQLLLTQRAAQHMISAGSGAIVTITSNAGMSDPPAPVGEGGWPAAYGCSKGGVHRLAGVLAVELGPSGVCAYNVEPGFVLTERTRGKPEYAWAEQHGNTPEEVGAVIAWLLDQPADVVANGSTVRVSKIAKALGLRPDAAPANER